MGLNLLKKLKSNYFAKSGDGQVHEKSERGYDSE